MQDSNFEKIYFKKISNERNFRKEKLKKLRKEKIAFPNNFKKSKLSYDLHLKYDNSSNEELKLLNLKIKVAGRIISKRNMGLASFLTLQDINGTIQLYISIKFLGKKKYKEFLKIIDIGDILGAKGILFKTGSGELSVRCIEIYILTKSIRSLPEKFHGIHNTEICYRQRYLDLISNKKSRENFILRSRIIEEVRCFMKKKGFIEVETPMMHPIPGGAIARPFVTHHNSLHTDMYLRIAPELYLKKLIIGGFEKIFELNKSFRNEGISTKHNPEFTMMESYMAYSDYHDAMCFIEELLRTLSIKIFGNTIIKYGKYRFDFSKPFLKMSMKDAICFFNKKINPKELNKLNSAIEVAKSLSINVKGKKLKLGNIQNEIFEKVTKNKIIEPTFITLYPAEVSPLSRRNDEDENLADRFELFIGGMEIGNGFSELNDFECQKKLFINQSKYKESIVPYDKDYILALEYGLPPTAGLGIGIDRLVMILTNNQSIRDVIFFPTVRKK